MGRVASSAICTTLENINAIIRAVKMLRSLIVSCFKKRLIASGIFMPSADMLCARSKFPRFFIMSPAACTVWSEGDSSGAGATVGCSVGAGTGDTSGAATGFGGGLRHTIREELELVKPDWIREITDAVTHAVGDKIDKMYVKLDKFIGEIKARREEDTMTASRASRNKPE